LIELNEKENELANSFETIDWTEV